MIKYNKNTKNQQRAGLFLSVQLIKHSFHPELLSTDTQTCSGLN